VAWCWSDPRLHQDVTTLFSDPQIHEQTRRLRGGQKLIAFVVNLRGTLMNVKNTWNSHIYACTTPLTRTLRKHSIFLQLFRSSPEIHNHRYRPTQKIYWTRMCLFVKWSCGHKRCAPVLFMRVLNWFAMWQTDYHWENGHAEIWKDKIHILGWTSSAPSETYTRESWFALKDSDLATPKHLSAPLPSLAIVWNAPVKWQVVSATP